jgi:C-terminal processing protease CtpA/Prc
MRFNLTGDAFVRFSTADFRRTDGTPIEGRGIEPDIPVELTAADCAGADRDLAAAEAALTAEGKR